MLNFFKNSKELDIILIGDQKLGEFLSKKINFCEKELVEEQ